MSAEAKQRFCHHIPLIHLLPWQHTLLLHYISITGGNIVLFTIFESNRNFADWGLTYKTWDRHAHHKLRYWGATENVEWKHHTLCYYCLSPKYHPRHQSAFVSLDKEQLSPFSTRHFDPLHFSVHHWKFVCSVCVHAAHGHSLWSLTLLTVVFAEPQGHGQLTTCTSHTPGGPLWADSWDIREKFLAFSTLVLYKIRLHKGFPYWWEFTVCCACLITQSSHKPSQWRFTHFMREARRQLKEPTWTEERRKFSPWEHSPIFGRVMQYRILWEY